jgi:SAM-dependent methyltransferase
VTDTHSSEGLYTGGEYAERHPTWHIEDSSWKADQIARMVQQNQLAVRKVVDVGCGAGEVLRQVHQRLPGAKECVGYEISPQAYQMTSERAAPGLRFELGDFLESDESDVDLLLLIDVIEHVEDYLGFLRRLRGRARHTILHVPLDLSIEWLLRVTPLVNARRTMGHIHYFTKEITFEALRDTGYEVVDSFYTRWGIELFYPSWDMVRRDDRPIKTGVRKVLQHGLYALSPDVAARITRGWSLLVLAR